MTDLQFGLSLLAKGHGGAPLGVGGGGVMCPAVGGGGGEGKGAGRGHYLSRL